MNYKNIFFSTFFLFLSVFVNAQEKAVFYFDNNKFELNKKENIRFNQWIINNKTSKILSISGSTDEVGSSGYNDTLSQKRIDCIYKRVENYVAIRSDFKTINLGEKGATSANKAENRKAIIYYLLEKDLAKENEILGIKPKVEEVVEVPKKEISYPSQVVFTNPDGSKSEFKLDVAFMKQVTEAKSGEKLKIENLNFIINTFAVVNESRGKLFELLLVMQKNPQLKIEIQGHLCCMAKDRTDLSTQRAKYIANFLRQQGIENERVTYKGFGSTMPIYPIPEKNEGERAANRRVEVLIVEN